MHDTPPIYAYECYNITYLNLYNMCIYVVMKFLINKYPAKKMWVKLIVFIDKVKMLLSNPSFVIKMNFIKL